MIHNIIHIPNQYLLIVDVADDVTLSDGEYFALGDKDSGYRINRYLDTSKSGKERYTTHLSRKILAHLPLNNSPILERVDLLPELEDEWVSHFHKTFSCIGILDKKTQSHFRDGFMEGYKATTKTYTEEDLRKAWEAGVHFNEEANKSFMKNEESKWDWNNVIQSLNQPEIPVAFKTPEVEKPYPTVISVRNEQGIFVWQGEYIFKTE